MRIRGDVRSFASWRQLAAQMLVVVLCLRALIPIGFMTDALAAKDGVFKIIICNAHGGSTLYDLDLGGKDQPEQSSAKHDQPCAFAGIAVDFSDAVHGYTIVKPRITSGASIHATHHDILPPARAGPVLGSRAPPAHS